MRRSLLLLVLPFLLSARGDAQDTNFTSLVATQTIIIAKAGPPLLQPPILARTVCNEQTNDILILVDSTMPDSMYGRAMAHELTHAGQMEMAGSCHTADSLYLNDVVYRFHAELDAYCSEAKGQKLMGRTVRQPFELPFPLYMFLTYGQQFTTLFSARDIVQRDCPLLMPSDSGGKT